MARNKTLDEKIKAAKEKKEQYEQQMKELLQAQKVQERKERTKRLCRRAGHLEKILPETITLTDEQVDLFLDETLLTSFSRKILANIISGQIKPTEKPAEARERDGEDRQENPQGSESADAPGAAGRISGAE